MISALALGGVLWSALAAAGVTLEPGEGCTAGFVELVRAEFEAAGFDTRLAADASQAQPPLARITLGCEVARGAVEVRVDDALTRKRVERTVDLAPDPRAEARAAVEAVEVLRASLAEVRFRGLAQVPDDVRTFVAADPPQRAAASVWRGVLQAGVAVAPGGFGAEPMVRGAVCRRLGPLAIAVEGGATVRASRLAGQGGYADVGLFDAALALELPIEFTHVALRPRVGGGVLGVWASGTARRGFVAQLTASATFLPTLGLAVDAGGFRAAPWLLISASASVGVTPAPVELRFPDGVAGRIGLPVFFLTLGLGAR